ncbi:MAG: bifunctional heptose 7-phosphate kinase/heptose 1-phosphate adenyltransferase [Gammaproteobacteria bacterium RIFCSPHIGHO2_12_FULL_35_23]|nr:MAG: bifunctional heptose 7-phosphate kinase/heptose 1-phosphate adenyltransferase [Gammaproteobacteria bacterium RIFCSPHIGHO2_12_FULL_35_23]
MKRNLVNFSEVKVLIVGDIMLDRYWSGPTSRISPEAPVPVVRVEQIEERPGGAGNVALNIAALGAKAVLLGAVGSDANGKTLKGRLTAAGVNCQLQVLEDIPTVTKLRVLSRHQQLIRLDFEENLTAINRKQLLAEYCAELAEADVVILSDYGKGTLTELTEFIRLANEAGVPTFVDPKNSDFSHYHGATMVTPNLHEFEAVVGPCKDEAELVHKAIKLMDKHAIKYLLITRGEKGMTLIRPDKTEMHVPSLAKEVFDVTGAGDTVIAAVATAFASGLAPAEAVKIANTAAGIAVSKLGAATVSIPELRRALLKEQNNSGVVNEEQLMLAVAEARAHHETVVMTNGCFDILHAGHVHYLNQAKTQGHRLIVAINDDASVARLKGPNRPINTIEKRMAVIAGLGSVDWVVPFADDTPERLIEKIKPDVLVKGGDYKPEEVVGADQVLAYGGLVKVLGLVEGLSTSSVIDKINSDKEKIS